MKIKEGNLRTWGLGVPYFLARPRWARSKSPFFYSKCFRIRVGDAATARICLGVNLYQMSISIHFQGLFLTRASKNQSVSHSYRMKSQCFRNMLKHHFPWLNSNSSQHFDGKSPTFTPPSTNRPSCCASISCFLEVYEDEISRSFCPTMKTNKQIGLKL